MFRFFRSFSVFGRFTGRIFDKPIAVDSTSKKTPMYSDERLSIIDLEPRIMMSATWIDPDDAGGSFASFEGLSNDAILAELLDLQSGGKATADAFNSTVNAQQSPSPLESSLDELEQLLTKLQSPSLDDTGALNSIANAVPTTETDAGADIPIVIVDYRVEDVDTLLSGLGLSDSIVFQLDAGSNGLEQISNFLTQFAPDSIDSIYVLSHGSAGTLELGNAEITSDNLGDYSDMLAQWSSVLDMDADILFFGCDVAKTDAGQAMLEQFSLYVGADVAGSTDITGNQSLGGDWTLEFQTGDIKATIDFNWAVLDQYQFTMVTGSSGADFIVGTAIADNHDGLGGNDLILGGANLAADGQFLSGTASGSYSTYSSGQSFGGWTVTQGSVDLLGSFGYASPSGGRGVDMDGNDPGAVSQTLTTVVGNTYAVRFALSTNSSGGATTKAVELSVGGVATDYSVTTSASSTSVSPEWVEKTYTFVATSTATTLQFRSLSPSGSGGAILGDVAVADLSASNGDNLLTGGAGDDTIDLHPSWQVGGFNRLSVRETTTVELVWVGRPSDDSRCVVNSVYSRYEVIKNCAY